MTERQARILLRRQVTQLPRWLGQARYNGPPKTHHGLLVALPHDYATNPSVSADGTHVVYEQYRQKLPVALRLGEIAVVSRDLRSGRDTLVSRPAAPRPNQPLDPRSAYNATVSGDGRLVAYESSPGNVNFAKRYGRIGVHLADTARGRTTRIDHPPRGEDLSQSAYNPQLAADGRHLAFQAVRGAGTAQVFVCDLHTGSRTLASGGLPRAPRGTVTSIYEPRLTADGRFVAFTAVTSRAGGGPGRDRLEVVLRDLVAAHLDDRQRRRRGLRLGSDRVGRRPPGRLHRRRSRAPALPARRPGGRGARRSPTPDAGAVVDPQLSADGRVLAYTVVRGARSHVEVRRLDSGAVEQVASAKGSVTDPSLSADGARPGLHLRCARPRAGQDRSQPRRLRPRPARRHDDARQRADEAGARQGAAADGHGARGARPGEHRHARRPADQHPRQRLRPRPRGPDAAGHAAGRSSPGAGAASPRTT